MCISSVQVQRLADYERYLGQEARNLIDSECIDSGTVLHRGQLEGDLHRIQELFPGDNLRLHERDVVTTVYDVFFFINIRILFEVSPFILIAILPLPFILIAILLI